MRLLTDAIMKAKTFVLGCGAISVIFVLIATFIYPRAQSQITDTAATATNVSAPDSSVPSDNPDRTPALGLFPLNTNTWEVVERDGKPIDGLINSQKAKQERYLANLALTAPAEYERVHPMTVEERAASDYAVQALLNPRTVDELLADIVDPAELARVKASMSAMENPKPVTDEIIKALQADPAGIWSRMWRLPAANQ
jgi:hypothetical protein